MLVLDPGTRLAMSEISHYKVESAAEQIELKFVSRLINTTVSYSTSENHSLLPLSLQ